MEMEVTFTHPLKVFRGERFAKTMEVVERAVTNLCLPPDKKEVQLGWSPERLTVVRRYAQRRQFDLEHLILSRLEFYWKQNRNFRINGFGREGILSFWGFGPKVNSKIMELVLDVENACENLGEASKFVGALQELIVAIRGESNTASGFEAIELAVTLIDRIVVEIRDGAVLTEERYCRLKQALQTLQEEFSECEYWGGGETSVLKIIGGINNQLYDLRNSDSLHFFD